MTPGQAVHENQERAQARSGPAGAGPGTVTLLPTRAREVAADEDHASARSETARLRPRRTARLRDVSRDVQLGVAGERSLAPDHDAPGTGEGAELFLSPHTVKSQAISIYRKLGVSSRRDAVACARKSRLLET